jgi:predicted ATP-grasp superfamily ATP-dependent carboligase
VETLQELGQRLEKKGVLYPCDDLSVLAVSRQRQRLEPWYHVMLPEGDIVEMLMDKNRFYAYAQEEGLPIPQTYWLRSRGDAEGAAVEIEFPCVLKPALKTVAWQEHVGQKAFKIRSEEELLAIYDTVAAYADVILVQQWIEGKDSELYVCYCYFDREGEPVATFVAQKLRQWPPQVGIGCLRIEARNDFLREQTLRLFRTVGYTGPGYVEMKRDERSGRSYITQPCVGRPGVGTAIAEAGGVQMHYAMYCDALGWPLPSNMEQTYRGTKWIRLEADIRSALQLYRQGELSLSDWWRSWQGPRVYASFSWSDPLPFWGNLPGAISRQLVGQLRKTR